MGSGWSEVYRCHQRAPGPDCLPLPCGQEGARDLPGGATHQQVRPVLMPAPISSPPFSGTQGTALLPPPSPSSSVPAHHPKGSGESATAGGDVVWGGVSKGQPRLLPAPPPPRQVPDLPPGGDHPDCCECCGRAQRVSAVPTHTFHGSRGPQGKLPAPAHSSILLPFPLTRTFPCTPVSGHIPHLPHSAANLPHVHLEARAQMDQ